MKKFIRFLVVFLLIVVVIMFSLALYEPQDVLVTRTVLIKAPKEAVFEQMVQFKNWTNWSPWYLMDTSMKMTYSGPAGQVGSSYQWKGQENKTGAGEMKITSIEGTSMNFDVRFTAPREGTATSTLTAKDTAGMSRATWNFSMHVSFPFNSMDAFINMDKMLGGDFEAGLATMKKYVETHTTLPEAIAVNEVDYPAHVFEGIRQVVPMSDLMNFFATNIKAVSAELKDKINGPATGLFYTWDTVAKNSDIALVYPVADTSKIITGGIVIHVGQSKAFMAVLKGGYASDYKVHMALTREVTAKGKTKTLTIEEYIAGPSNEVDSNKWVTNIYYLVQ